MAASGTLSWSLRPALLEGQTSFEAWRRLTCHSEYSPAHSNVILNLKDEITKRSAL
jgi:hypothetical protein